MSASNEWSIPEDMQPDPADLTAEIGKPESAKPKTASTPQGEKHTASKPFRKVGGKLQKFFTGKDTITK